MLASALLVELCLQGLGLVFVAVYQKTLSLMYVDELLGLVRDAFIEGYSPNNYNYEAFGSRFNKILRDCEARADAARRNAAVAQVRFVLWYASQQQVLMATLA